MLGFFALLFGGSYIAGETIKGKMYDGYYKSKEEYRRKRYDEIDKRYGHTVDDSQRISRYASDFKNQEEIFNTFESELRFIVHGDIDKLKTSYDPLEWEPSKRRQKWLIPDKWKEGLLLAKEGKIDTYFWAYEGAYNSLNHVIVDSFEHRFLLLMNKKYIEIDPDLELVEKKNRKLCPDGKHYELGDIEPKYLIPEYELKNYTKLS